MLIKIQGLPFKSKYQDVKLLVRSECTITDFKLDNLVGDSDGTKKVLVTVGNEAEAFCLIKCLNGYRMSNCVLRVEPISTPKSTDVNPPQNTYEQRPGPNYPHQNRSDYPSQMSNDYNHAPHSYGQSGHNIRTLRSVEPVGGRNEGWNSANVPGNQWSHQTNTPQRPLSSGFPGTPIYPQHPSVPQRVNSSYPANRPQQSPNYGYTPKSNMPDAGITIMKDNFQGPTMYQIGGNSGPYPGGSRDAPVIWNQGQEPKPQGYSKPLPYEKYDDDRRQVHIDKRSDGKKLQDDRVAVYKDYEKSRQFSPTRRGGTRNTSPSMKKRRPSPPTTSHREILARKLASPERKISPMGVAMSGRLSPPIRNMSPPIRRVSPSGRWVPVGRPASPHGRRFSPSDRRLSPSGRRLSPPGRRPSPLGRRPSPSGRRLSPSGKRPSPSGRRPSPSARRPSPSGRRISPMSGRVLTTNMPGSPSARRISPSGRRPQSLERRSPSGRMSPQRVVGRHVSPSGRRMSPSDRRISPGDRRMLERRESPRRLVQKKRGSPNFRMESPPPSSRPQASRYSPRRHPDDKIVDPKMDIDGVKSKLVRPAYDSQASSQAMYSGGYRQNLKENVAYSTSAARQPEQRISPWQQERDKNTYPPLKKQDDDRRDINEKRPSRQSRSPVHRDRSPIRDHYRTSSPVSRSPRRSWALEKRPYGRSPEASEAPPPPIWPGKNPRDDDPYKNKFTSREDIPKHPTIWERPSMKLEEPKQLEEPRRSGEDKLRVRGMPQRDIRSAPFDQNQREPKFNPRHDLQEGRKEDYQRQRDMMRRSPDRRDFREAHPSIHEERRYDDYRPRLRSPGREDTKKPVFIQEFDKDFEDIYKRSQEFRKKAEQMRRSGDRRRDDHIDEEHSVSHREEKYDRRRETSPHRRADFDRLEREPERRYEDPKYKDREPRDKEPEWKSVDKAKRIQLPPHVKVKRDKAADEILEKIMHKYKQIGELNDIQKKRVAEELKLALMLLFMDMFGDADVAFIEIVIKYQAKMGSKQEEAMVRDVLESLPSMFRLGKRSAPEPEESTKMARYSPETAMKEEKRPRWSPTKQAPHWETRPRLEHSEVDRPRYEKYGYHPEEQRPKYVHKRIDDKPIMRNLPAPKSNLPTQRPNLPIQRPNLPIQRTNLPTQRPNLQIQRSNVLTQRPNLPTPRIKYDAAPKQKYERLSAKAKIKPKPQIKPKQEIVQKRVMNLKPITPVKPKVQVVPKVSPKIEESLATQANSAIAKQTGVEEPAPEDAADAPGTTPGYYELSPMMARVLDMELQDIMIKVWQELPDKPTTDAEKLVVNKLRNEAGDDLRNVFGLNASQRLLNVFNVMYIKMKFTANPDGQELTLFLMKNGISNFKWNNVKPLSFVAVVQNVNDFDRLCATQNYTIGNVKVNITPLYQFTKCPQRLRTSYNIVNATSKKATPSTSKVEASEQTNPVEEVAKGKPADDASNSDKQTKPADTKSMPAKTVEKPTVVKETAKVETVVAKAKPKEAKATTTTSVANKNVENVVKKEEKKQVDKKEIKKEPVKKPAGKKTRASSTNILQDGNDYDELDDDEIMALVSQGIILDECSGSDID